MILKELKIKGYGPFYDETNLEIEESVTILTGQNDVGKSSILRLIKLLYTGEKGSDRDTNVNHMLESVAAPGKDHSVTCYATFAWTSRSKNYVNGGGQLSPGKDEVVIQYHVSNGKRSDVAYRKDRKALDPKSHGVPRFPQVIFVDDSIGVRDKIDPRDANAIESKMLSMAFGEDITRLETLDESYLDSLLRDGVKNLNNRLRAKLGNSIDFSLELKDKINAEGGISFSVGLLDRLGGDTPIELRGKGIRKIITLLVGLLSIDFDKDHVMILLDEPENSLHANSQHMLRRILENLAESETVQVVYATHSPSMINTVDPKGLRLLERIAQDGKVTTRVNNKPYYGNYLPIRASLGLSPADSLLYAPVTVIVEGPTEVLCIPTLLKRMGEEKRPRFDGVLHLLSMCHFVNGMGEAFDKWCRMAESQGSRPIIFVDGDKTDRINKLDKERKIPENTPIIQLPQGMELEDIVPRRNYFEALSIALKDQEVSLEAFETWAKTTAFKNPMFSKQVEQWLRERNEGDQVLQHTSKPKILRKAVEAVPLDEINEDALAKLVDLVKAMRNEVEILARLAN